LPRPLVVVALILAAACGREVVFVDPPPTSTTDTTGTDSTGTDTTVVQRVDLQITVTIAPADTALARRLGLANGRLSNAQVTARRVAGQQGPQTGTTDSLGQVTLPQLIEGMWAITAGRSLTEAERALLDSANGDVTGFGGSGQFTVAASAPALTIEALAGRQGTLVIAELYLAVDNATTGYTLGQYVKVHNNTTATLYLDQRVIGRAIPGVESTVFACSTSARWREDPEGIWSQRLWAFPGSGRDYPLPPGGDAVIATDAIDHRVFHPSLPDLSRADFEFLGSNDVDNPGVPNMRNFAGWSESPGDPVGHGPYWVSWIDLYLAEPLHPDSLLRENLPLPLPAYVRVPGDMVLDVLTSGKTPETQGASRYCAHFVHPSFDQQFARLVDGTSLTYSAARRPLAGTSPALNLLQRTKSSAIDFFRAAPAPPVSVRTAGTATGLRLRDQ